jgi:hypothetical protein
VTLDQSVGSLQEFLVSISEDTGVEWLSNIVVWSDIDMDDGYVVHTPTSTTRSAFSCTITHSGFSIKGDELETPDPWWPLARRMLDFGNVYPDEEGSFTIEFRQDAPTITAAIYGCIGKASRWLDEFLKRVSRHA